MVDVVRIRQKLLEVIRTAGPDGATRSQIAKSLGRRSCGPVEDTLLSLLIVEGLIEQQRVPRPGGISFHLLYRAIPQESKR